MHRRLSIVIVVLVILAGNLPPSAQAAPNATITVQSAADDGTVNAANCPGASCRLRDAIAMAASGDTINFGGDYTITLTVGALTIDKNLTIDGAGHTITISGNHAVRVFYVNSGYTVNLQDLTITQGNCGSNCSGGGLYNSAASTVNISNSIFLDNINSAPSGGGGLYNDSGTVNVTNSTFSNNSTYFGGGLYNESGTLNVTSSIFSNNSASYAGGGIMNYDGTLNVTSSSFFSNSVPIDGSVANRYGGGINTYGGVTTVKNSTFNGNSANAGGGLYVNSGTATVQNSTFSSNQAEIGGGFYTDYGSITLTDTTVTGNLAHGGGGIANNAGTITVTNSTITGNSGSFVGGGIINNAGAITVTNSIIATQTAGADCVGTIISHGYNIESNNSCDFTDGVNGDNQLIVSGGSLNLQPLANNGTQPHPFTHALGAGSVAIDQIPIGVNGCVSGLSTDERGGQRANGAGHGGSACDIGAYEYDSDFTPTAITLRDLSATSSTSPGIVGAACAAFVALGAFVIGRRRQRVPDGRKGEAFAK